MSKKISGLASVALIAGTASFTSGSAVAASFSCANPTTYATITICNDSGVSTLDSHLGDAYNNARSYYKNRGRWSDSKAVKREQKRWINDRNRACSSSDSKAPRNYWPEQWQFDCFYNETRQRVETLMWEMPKQSWPNYYWNWCSDYSFNCN